MEKNNFIQMWRGIAMCAVVLIHCVWQMDNSNLIAFSYSIIFRQCLNFAVGTFMFFCRIFCRYKKFESKAYIFKRIKSLQFIELVSALGISYIVLVIMKKVLRGKSYLIGV